MQEGCLYYLDIIICTKCSTALKRNHRWLEQFLRTVKGNTVTADHVIIPVLVQIFGVVVTACEPNQSIPTRLFHRIRDKQTQKGISASYLAKVALSVEDSRVNHYHDHH